MEERVEAFSNYSFELLNSSQLVSFLNLMFSIVPAKKSLKLRFLMNIFFLDVISSYRGWRHSKGLPVRGQRTWTNAWTSYKNNLVLREYKILLVKRLYGNLPTNELNTTYLAEQINLLWKLQWEQEWREAKKRRLATLKKSAGLAKVDLYSMSKGIIDARSTKTDSKKQKTSFKKNYFTLGFDPGFTKALLKSSLLNSKKQGSTGKTVAIFGNQETKSKIIKKKVKKK